MALATITMRGLGLTARRATSIVPLASRVASPQFARRLPQNLITGASATTPAKALQLSKIIGKSTEADFSKTLVDETLAWPKVEMFQPTTAIEADTAILIIDVTDLSDVAQSAAQLDRRVRFKAGKPAGATLVTIIKAHLANRT